MVFKFLMFEGARPHICPESLVEGIVQDLLDREHPLDLTHALHGKESAEAFIDYGGGIFQGMPTHTIDVGDGLSVGVWCHQAGGVMRQIEKRIEEGVRRTATGQLYYKLHGAWTCLVLTPDQMQALLLGLDLAFSEIQRREDEFWIEWDKKRGFLPNMPAATA